MIAFKSLTISIICAAFAYLYVVGMLKLANLFDKTKRQSMIPGLDGMAEITLIVFFTVSGFLLSWLFFFESLIVTSLISLAVTLLISRKILMESFRWLMRESGKEYIKLNNGAINYAQKDFLQGISFLAANFVFFEIISLIVWFLKDLDLTF